VKEVQCHVAVAQAYTVAEVGS